MNSKLYAQQTGAFPADVDIMVQEGYMNLSKSVTDKWNFDISGLDLTDAGDIEGQISATSTALMGGGEEKTLVFNITEGKWTGYGQEDSGEGGGE